MPRIDQRLEPRAVRTRRRGIAVVRRRVAERFVWALGIVALPETIEAARCCAARCACGGRAVVAFSVLCIRSCRPFCSGCAGSMSSGRTPSRTPPYRQRRQSPQRIGGKRLPIVGADPFGEAVAAKQALKHGPTAFGGRPEQAAAAEQE